jgi:SsrA-binding protein
MGTIKNKTYSKNRKAYHDYEMIKSYEAGMRLTGPQVKSIRASTINLLGSYASVEDGQVFLKQCHISKPNNLGYNGNFFDENANIPLLLNKKEINDIYKAIKERGITLIPLAIYQRENTKSIKIEIALAKGKRDYDKRQALKNKQASIDTSRELKKY